MYLLIGKRHHKKTTQIDRRYIYGVPYHFNWIAAKAKGLAIYLVVHL